MPTSVVRRLRWALWERRTAQRMVEEIDKWTGQVQGLIETVWWPLFSTSAQLFRLEEDSDAGPVGLLHGLALRQLLVHDARPPNGQDLKTLEIPLDHFRICSTIGSLTTGQITTGQITDRPDTVMVEYKSYKLSQDSTPDSDIVRRIRQLAQLLSTQSDPSLMTLPCTAFFDDPTNARFGLLFQFSRTLEQEPVTLGHEFTTRDPPRLDARIKLAYDLAVSLQSLHSVGWLHRGLCSENVLLFRCHSGPPGLPWSNPDEWMNWRHPKLVGFEHMGRGSAFSNGWQDRDNARNLYKHPSLCSWVETPFTKYHDIYGNLSAILRHSIVLFF